MPDLVLSTPDGVPEKISGIWDRQLFTTVRADRIDTETASLGAEIRALHGQILNDHQKYWFQMCRRGYQLLEQDDYPGTVERILAKFAEDSPSAIVDPLLCFFAPLWAGQIEKPVFIFLFTEPMECAVRLQDKWRFPIHFGLALWEYYVLSGVAQLKQQEYLLFSHAHFRTSPSDYLQDFARRYQNLKGVVPVADAPWRVSPSAGPDSAVVGPDRGRYITQAQERLFDALETNRVEVVQDMSLSAEAEDILFHYGNLRAGYEQIKGASAQIPKGLTTGMSEEVNHQVHRNDKMDESFLEVVVHIEGMRPLRFLSQPDNPIIELLSTTLQNQSHNPNQLVYLESSGPDVGTLYFLARDLLAFETTPSVS